MPKSIDVESVYVATTQVFCERGFGGTTTKEIADRAGINEVTLFRRFGTKVALVEAAITEILSKAPFAQFPPTDDVRQDLVNVVRSFLETHGEFGGLVMTLIAQVTHYPELQGAARALIPNMQAVAGIIASHQEKGRIREGNPDQFALKLIAPLAVAGFMEVAKLAPEEFDFDADDHVELFLKGHGA
ncbi:MAG: TetR/AcrR family transcriptional regulator [Roseibium sp.]|uniref:TetR/AcrR family transcriptional regulator n=1 Tax=Roseibium sp. TaxID=1936156 RepID=UPI001B1E1163|nr:TetR/AcrR family transcriptional regulator [Roseibium sp.]MBO6506962.1 TetR/AcrR family transcriptional regulator [Roseibium sp.]MBO6890599.1 TetR/AcrR family transcriptional regulator [Roseibium sp.]MBO6930159.1 TetR/AcrR family transcriptional regulator [Roseibium sp.]